MATLCWTFLERLTEHPGHSEERSDEESEMLRLHFVPAQQDNPGVGLDLLREKQEGGTLWNLDCFLSFLAGTE